MAATALDRLIGWINPRAGLARHFDRQRLSRAYEAASQRDPWKPRRSGASANADHAADGATLRYKARALVQNVPYIAVGLEGLVDYTIGEGIVPRSTGVEADKLNKLMEEWFEVCDADGRLNYFGMQAAAYHAMETDGEVLIRLRARRPADGLPIPLQLQLLEIDWLDSSKTGTVNGDTIVNGIQHDPLGRVSGYWLFDSHPGDVQPTMRRSIRTQSHFVPASLIIHLFRRGRPGQARGITRLAPVITRVRDFSLYEDAEGARKNLETRLSVLASGDASSLANPPDLTSTASPSDARATGSLGELASGGITELPAGMGITVLEPKAAPGYVDYSKHQLHIIAAAVGVPYEMMTGDMSEVNMSSARVRRLDFKRAVEKERATNLVPNMLRRVHRAGVDAALLNGSIRTRDYSMDWSAPKWDYTNPEKEVRADIDEISVGLSTVSEKLRQRGYKPAEVFAEIAKDAEAMKSLGIQELLLFKEKGGSPQAAAQEKASATAARALDAMAQLMARIDTRLASLEQRSTSVVVNQGDSTVNVPERSLIVEAAQIHVPPAEVTVNNEVRTEAPIVNVPQQPAPVVNVTAQAAAPEVRIDNQMPAAEVHVTVPPRQTVTDIERDGAGRIKRTTQREL